MIYWLITTCGVGAVSALIPVVNLEVYLVALLAAQSDLPWPLVGLAAAIGQMMGKLAFYYGGRGGSRLHARLRRRTERKPAGRWARRLERFRETCQQRPVWAAGVLLTSASVGLPPYALVAVVAGSCGIGLVMFSTTGLLGRAARFCAVAAAPGLLAYF